ncbi:MAG TPA: NF038122 family metalloprotease [Bryobacteraceae bacterium]|nr:NF038122 family metalloprotease [Bryobacteraceae bacterium]
MVTAGTPIAGQSQHSVRESHVISLAGLAPSPSGAAAPSGIAYTCDPSVTAVAGVCSYLNSTIAGIYAGTFTNASTSIYIKFANIGSGDAGQSNFLLNDVSYSAFRSALQSHLTSANDTTAFNASVPATNPINSGYGVYLTLSGMRALGFTPSGGMTSSGGSCSSGTAGCYDGIITMSSTIQSAGNYYFRSGSIGPSQYDFFTTVQHETDEVIGTASCAFDACGGSHIAPADLFRYQSNGARSFAAGNNDSCSSASAGNACFSIDGVHMLQHYYNINDGYDAGDWVPSCSPELVQGSVCAGTAPAPVITTNQVTSASSGIVNGVCAPPPLVSSFTTQSPQVYVFFDFSGASVGDSAQIQFIRPDNVVYSSATTSIATAAGCLSQVMNISGTAAASFPGLWKARVTWNQSTTPLLVLNFTLAPANCSYSLGDGGEAFGAAVGNGSIAVTAPLGCPWSVSGTPTWVIATSGSGTGNGSFIFQVLSNAGAARVANLTIGGVAFSIEQQAFAIPGLTFIGSMPHMAAEENWTTTFTLVDKSAFAATARLSLFGDPSGALLLPLVFPQSPGAAPILASSLDQTIAANASLLITTAGPQTPPVEVGSAQLAAAGAVDGFAIFHLIPGAQEAVVPLETRNASSYLLAFDNTGGVLLGVAVENV